MNDAAGPAMAGRRSWRRARRALVCLFALSRTPHALLDLATPAAAALLWLGRFPSLSTIVMGLVAAFAGYTSVYAINDIVDCHEDRRRSKLGCKDYGDYLDARMLRHPLAECAISMRAAVSWAAGWGTLALTVAIVLNPVCAYIFAGAIAMEAGYCLLCRVTPLRTLVSGVVKFAGPLAAVFAVDQAPDAGRLALLFAWVFLWEIGGQNIPADWSDKEEDRALGHRTLPVTLEAAGASRLALVTMSGSVLISPFLASLTSPVDAGIFLAGTLAAGIALLVIPAIRLVRSRTRAEALAVFNRASFYPLCVLGAVSGSVWLRSLAR